MTDVTDAADRWWQRWVGTVAEEGQRFGALARNLDAGPTGMPGRLDVRVPWIPAWTARDLVGHLGTVHRWATAIVRAGTTDAPPPESLQDPPADALLEWYADGLAGVLAALRQTPPGAPAWHMSPAARRIAADWARRQAHELVVHRMDLEAAAGTPCAPVDPELAEDGVDELLGIVVPRWAHTEPVSSARATVLASAVDTGRRWTVAVDHGSVLVRPGGTGGAAAPDATVEGTAVQLLLHLWGRPAEVTVTGDPAAEALLRGR